MHKLITLRCSKHTSFYGADDGKLSLLDNRDMSLLSLPPVPELALEQLLEACLMQSLARVSQKQLSKIRNLYFIYQI